MHPLELLKFSQLSKNGNFQIHLLLHHPIWAFSPRPSTLDIYYILLSNYLFMHVFGSWVFTFWLNKRN